jgi:anti-anti-sigma factor
VIIEFVDTPPILRCTGDEDRSTQSQRRRALVRALSAQADVRVELHGLVFADSSLMIDLAMLSRRLRRRGGKLLLCDAQPQIMALIEGVGLHRLPGVRIAGPQPAIA